MKSILFLLFLFTFAIANAQTSETISELTPVPSNVGKFVGKLPGKSLKFNVKTELINLPNDKKGISISVQIDWNELIFENIGGKPTAKLSIYGRITSKDKKVDGFFEEKSVVTVEIEELQNSRGKSITLRKVFELPDGKYQIGIIIRDLFSYFDDSYHGDSLINQKFTYIRGIKVIKFQIPKSE